MGMGALPSGGLHLRGSIYKQSIGRPAALVALSVGYKARILIGKVEPFTPGCLQYRR